MADHRETGGNKVVSLADFIRKKKAFIDDGFSDEEEVSEGIYQDDHLNPEEREEIRIVLKREFNELEGRLLDIHDCLQECFGGFGEISDKLDDVLNGIRDMSNDLDEDSPEPDDDFDPCL